MKEQFSSDNLSIYDLTPEERSRREARQEKLNKKKEEERRAAEAAAQRDKKFRKYLIVAVAVVVFVGLLCGKQFIQIYQLKKTLNESKENLYKLQSTIEDLEKTLELVQSDEYIESEARRKLHMIKRGEYPYIVEDE